MNDTFHLPTWARIAFASLLMATVSLPVFASADALNQAVVADAPTTKAVSVLDAKSNSKSGNRIFVEGRVKDFVEGHAVVTIADISMKSCRDNGESCPTPWDYCCEPKETITRNTATVKVVGAAGGNQAIKAGLKGVNGIDHLVVVTAEGTAQRDKSGNLVILAERLYVKK